MDVTMRLLKILSRKKPEKPALTIEEQVNEIYKRNPIVFDRLAEL